MSEPRPLVLHSSWRGRVSAAASPTLLLILGSIALAFRGWNVFPAVLAGIGLVLAAIALFDYPIRTVFGPDAVNRQCLLRTERIDWDRIGRVIRPASLGRVRGFRPSTGLVAELGKRRYLLIDRMESKAEHEALLDVVAAWAPGLLVETTAPPDDWPPTWLYKRRQGPSPDALVDEL